MDKVLLTAEQAAEVLSLGRTKVYELMAAGELRSVQVGRCRRIPAADLVAYVEGLRVAQGGQSLALVG